MIDTIFVQETAEAASAQWRIVADQLRVKFPKLAAMMDDAALLAATLRLALKVLLGALDDYDQAEGEKR
jgi:hypothetical protein